MKAYEAGVFKRAGILGRSPTPVLAEQTLAYVAGVGGILARESKKKESCQNLASSRTVPERTLSRREAGHAYR